jgi:hypothetical protein
VVKLCVSIDPKTQLKLFLNIYTNQGGTNQGSVSANLAWFGLNNKVGYYLVGQDQQPSWVVVVVHPGVKKKQFHWCSICDPANKIWMKKSENTLVSLASQVLAGQERNERWRGQAPIICQQGKGPLGAQLHPYPCVLLLSL